MEYYNIVAPAKEQVPMSIINIIAEFYQEMEPAASHITAINYAKTLLSNSQIFLIDAIKNPDGFISFISRNNNTAHINALYIKPSKRSKGLANKSLIDAMNQLKKHGFTSVTLGVDASNFKAIALYRSVGMKVYAQGTEDGRDYQLFRFQL